MVIVIEGKQGEGKTTLVNKITQGAKVLTISERDLHSRNWVSDLTDDTEYLVVEVVRELRKVKEQLVGPTHIAFIPLYSRCMQRIKLPPNVIIVKQS